MTLEQFKEKVKNYETLHSADGSIYKDEWMQELAHEIAMNVMDVMKHTVEEGYREGCRDTINEPSSVSLPGHIRRATKYKWQSSDIKKRLNNE